MKNSIGHQNLRELKPRIVVIGVGGAGGNALNNMISGGLEGVEFIAANTDAQALLSSKADTVIQIGAQLTEGLGAGSRAEIGAAAAEEAVEDIRKVLENAHMVFVTAGMGGGTGSGAAPVIARIARELGILTVGVVTKPFQFEGMTRMNTAEKAVTRLRDNVDTLIVIPNQNLFRVTNEQTTFSDAFAMADKVLHSGISSITDLMVKEGLINLDFADVKIVMSNKGKSMMGTGVASGENRGKEAAELAITNPLLDDVSLEGAKGVLVSIIGGRDLTLFEVEQAAEAIRKVVDKDANIIVGATFDEARKGDVLVAVLATGLSGVGGATVSQQSTLSHQSAAMPAPAPVEALPFEKEESVQSAKVVMTPTVDVENTFHAEPIASQEDLHVSGVDLGDSLANVTNQTNDDAWVNDDNVTISPIHHQKVKLAPVGNVAKKAHKEGKTEITGGPSFTPTPIKSVSNSPQNMPVLDDFSPLAQEAVKAKKGGGDEKEKGGSTLFARLSNLGKSRKKIDAVEEKEFSRKEPVLGNKDIVQKEAEAPIIAPISSSSSEKKEPIEMALTDEEMMEIPSFFKRKA